MAQTYDDAFIRDILDTTKTIALVGYSEKPERPSHRVANFLASKGYRVIPVNPGQAGKEALGETIVATLSDIPDEIEVDMVDIFRRSDAVGPVVDEALAALPNLKTIWMQLGVENEDAAATAEAKGVKVVMDRCPAIEHPRLIG
ncbi:MAG TPA: CoA-binding protein [Maritimibacter sp.]|nr:CoA-binding protein [Maritimibacter sp.]